MNDDILNFDDGLGSNSQIIVNDLEARLSRGEKPKDFPEALKADCRRDLKAVSKVQQNHLEIDILEAIAIPIKLSAVSAKLLNEVVVFEAIIDAESVGMATAEVVTLRCEFCEAVVRQTPPAPEVCTNCKRKALKQIADGSSFADFSYVFVKELPRNIEAADEEEYVSLQGKVWKIRFKGIPENARSVKIVAIVDGKPEGPKSEVLNIEFKALKMTPIEDEATTIKISPDEHEEFKKFFGGGIDIEKLFNNQVAPAIVGKEFHKEAKLLVLHSPLEAMDIYGQRKIRTALRLVEIADTKTAKTTQMQDISYGHYHLGELVVVETASRTGLLYNIDAENRVAHLGVIPLNDRGLVLMDGLQHLQADEMSQMREVLEVGRLKVNKAVKFERPARVRIIAAMNPRTPSTMADYYLRIDALIASYQFQDPADLTRWDIVLASGEKDVPVAAINSAVPGERPVPDKIFRDHVLWAWSLKAEDISYSETAKGKIVEAANALSEYVNARYPLVHNGVRDQITRVAIAYACLRHSVDDAFKVVVKEEHVEMAQSFITRMLEYLDFDEFIYGIKQTSELTAAEVERLTPLVESNHLKVLMEIAHGNTNAEAIGKAVGLSAQQIKQKYYSELKEWRLIETVPKVGAKLTPKGIAYLKMKTEPQEREDSKAIQIKLETKQPTILDYTLYELKMPTPMYLPKNPYLLCSGIVVDSGIVDSVYLTIRIKKEFEKTTDSNTLLATSNQTPANSSFQENENNASVVTEGPVAEHSITFLPSGSLPHSAVASPQDQEPQLSDFALSQKIHAVIDKVVHKIPAAGAIVGEKLNDFSYLLNADDFRDLPKDKVELELKNMVQLGDLKIVPNTGGFAVTPARKQDAETNDYDEY